MSGKNFRGTSVSGKGSKLSQVGAPPRIPIAVLQPLVYGYITAQDAAVELSWKREEVMHSLRYYGYKLRRKAYQDPVSQDILWAAKLKKMRLVTAANYLGVSYSRLIQLLRSHLLNRTEMTNT
jgi:hypothetical protein